MKKLIKALTLTLLCLAFVACSSNANSVALKDGMTVQDVVTLVGEKAPIQLPMELDETLAVDLANLNLDDVKDFAITKAGTMTSADIIAVVEAKEGKIDSVKASLEKMLETEKQNAYLPDQKEKVENALLTEKGNYVILLVNNDMKAAEEAVNECFQN